MVECFSKGSVTFILLGNNCTRRCRYCAVSKGAPMPPAESEPERIATTAKELSLSYVVLTSVTRDDLPDFGSGQFARTISKIREQTDPLTIEVLAPDFNGNIDAIETVLLSQPDIFGHNIETVEDLFRTIRPDGNYKTSIGILTHASSRGFITKSGIMVGLGETLDQVMSTFKDLKDAGVKVLTIGQYLKPNHECVDVSRYYEPPEFDRMKAIAEEIGIREVLAGPFVRSSYRPQAGW
jgi:lipoyl synthase